MTKVIVVDDEEDMADSIAQTLEIEGIDVLAKGHDGEEAFQLYEKLKPDVVLLDMKMPNYDGAYALEKIKGKYPDAKVVVVTAFTDYKFDNEQADAIIYKPYELKPFIQTIKNVASEEKISNLS